MDILHLITRGDKQLEVNLRKTRGALSVIYVNEAHKLQR